MPAIVLTHRERIAMAALAKWVSLPDAERALSYEQGPHDATWKPNYAAKDRAYATVEYAESTLPTGLRNIGPALINAIERGTYVPE